MSRKRSFIALVLLAWPVAALLAVLSVLNIFNFQFSNLLEVLVLAIAVWIGVVATGLWLRFSRGGQSAEVRTTVAQHQHQFGFASAIVSFGICISILGLSNGTALFAVGFIVSAIGGGWSFWLLWLILRAWPDRPIPTDGLN